MAPRDYIDKNGFAGVLLGLSGGIDSALTLALAVDALGAERVTAVMMPTRYTSQLSLDGARAQAVRLGVDYHVISIEATYESFVVALTPAFAGKPADTTEENLQSRTRVGVDVDGAQQQAWSPAAGDRQQERDGGGLRHAVRRHVRRLRAH